jgi:hypothetical protein
MVLPPLVFIRCERFTKRRIQVGFVSELIDKGEVTMLRAIICCTLGFVAGMYALTPKVKSAIFKDAEKMAEIAQNGTDYIKEEFGPSEKDRNRNFQFPNGLY